LIGQWDALNAQWKAGMERFNRTGIRELLVKEGERGSIGNTEIADSITGNSARAVDLYKGFKDFFGAASPEFQNLQRAAREKVLGTSISKTSDHISGASLASNLSNVRPEVAQELFGASRKDLFKIADELSKVEGNLDVDELRQLLSKGSLMPGEIRALADAEVKRVSVYNNRLIKAAANGELDAEQIKPSEFVRYVSKMDPSNAQKVMGALSERPDLVESVRQLAVEDLFSQGTYHTPDAIKKRLSSSLLREALGSEVQHRTWEVLIGKKTLDGIKKTTEVLSSREAAAEFSAGGHLSGAMDVARLAFSPDVGELKQLATRFLIGFVYSRPLRQPLINLMTSQDQARLLNSVIASEPFTRAVIDRFGETSPLIMSALRQTIEPAQKLQMQIKGQLPTKDLDLKGLSNEQFKQLMDNTFLQ
jgi:hypothetical protein